MIKICFITYKRLNQLVMEALSIYQDTEIEVTVVEGLRNEILERKNREMIEQAEIILAGGANAVIAKEAFQIPVLEFKITDFDYFVAIESGIALGERPAVVTYSAPASDNVMNYFVKKGESVVNIIYEDTEELCSRLQDCDADVVIGAAHAVEMGAKLGKKTVLIYPGLNSIIETVREAKTMVLELKKEREKNQFFNTMMDYSTNGFIFIDKDYKIIDFNRSVPRLTCIPGEKLKNTDVTKILPQLQEFADSERLENAGIIKTDSLEIYYNIVKLINRFAEFEGAVILLTKFAELKDYLRKAELERRSQKEKGFLAKKNFPDIIGCSPVIRTCVEDARFFAKSNANLLLYGETGVGKEIFAQSIHNSSERKNGPFIAVNCAALPDNLLETELFGYDEGAFTGGRKGGKKGLFELADRGTLFLDEIGEISSPLQSRLLRVLQEKEVMHVGGERIIPVDVRVISATNRNLESAGHEVFRRDLLYRLNVLELKIPPLCERGEDVVELFDYYYKIKRGIEIYYVDLTEEVKSIVRLYSWPGNIRELQNACERFCLYLEQRGKINSRYIKKCVIKAIGEERLLSEVLLRYRFDGKTATAELTDKLKEIFSYNKEQIAKILGVSRTTIWRMTHESDG